MADQTIQQECAFFGTTLNEHPDPRGLFRRAGDEIARLETLQAPVKCFECRREIARADEWFRCFDCRVHLCESCTQKHFGASYSRHHQTMQQYKDRVAILEQQIANNANRAP